MAQAIQLRIIIYYININTFESDAFIGDIRNNHRFGSMAAERRHHGHGQIDFQPVLLAALIRQRFLNIQSGMQEGAATFRQHQVPKKSL